MNEHRKQYLKYEADKIREQIKGGTLFGEPIDETDQDAMLFAGYLIGTMADHGLLYGDARVPKPKGFLSEMHLEGIKT